jgi:SAM-dependent methyltransferase
MRFQMETISPIQRPTRKIAITRKKTMKRSSNLSKLYNGLTGFGIDNNNYPDHKITYGEVLPESIPVLYEIFSKYAPLTKISQPYRNFYDIGCGVGKLIIGMASQHSFLKATGVEIVPERIISANTALQRIRDDSLKKRIEFLCISMLDDSLNYSNACWIFISNLCITLETNDKLFVKLANELKTGCIIVCSKSHSNTNFEELNIVTLPMTWSNTSKVYVYKKK